LLLRMPILRKQERHNQSSNRSSSFVGRQFWTSYSNLSRDWWWVRVRRGSIRRDYVVRIYTKTKTASRTTSTTRRRWVSLRVRKRQGWEPSHS